MHGMLFVVEFAAADDAAAAAAAAATAIAAEEDEEEEGQVGLPAAVTDIAAAALRGTAAIDIGIGIRIDASEDALLLLVMVFVSSVPYSPIEPTESPGVVSSW